MVLVSTSGMDLKQKLCKKYFFALIMLWYMKHYNYEKLKPKLIQSRGMSHITNEKRGRKRLPTPRIYLKSYLKDYTKERCTYLWFAGGS